MQSIEFQLVLNVIYWSLVDANLIYWFLMDFRASKSRKMYFFWALGGTTGCEGGYENLYYRFGCRDCTEVFPAAAQMWKVSGLSRESNYVVANA